MLMQIPSLEVLWEAFEETKLQEQHLRIGVSGSHSKEKEGERF